MNEKPVAIITGVAGGIGAATARAFASAGYQLTLLDIDQAALHELANSIEAPCLELGGDLSEMAFVGTVVPRTVERFGRVDVLINNAAWREVVSMRRITIESWERTLQVCLTAPAFLARDAAAAMERQRRGVIVNIGSLMIHQAAGISPAYVACKGALDALTYELASLYGPAGIRVLSLQPGAIDTDLAREVAQTEGPDEIREFSEDMIMLRRWGRPDEVAQTLLFLASDQASYITGTTLAIDGGWARQHLPLSLKTRHYSNDYP